MARLWAERFGLNFLSPGIFDLVHGAIGESERAITQFITEAKLQSPSLLLLDDFDVIFGGAQDDQQKDGEHSTTDSLSAALISALDELDSWNTHSDAKVYVVAATRRPWTVQSRFLQPQRFGVSFRLGLLSAEAKETWMERVCERDEWPLHFSTERLAWLREETIRCDLLCDILRMRREVRFFFGGRDGDLDNLRPPPTYPDDFMRPFSEWEEKSRQTSVFQD